MPRTQPLRKRPFTSKERTGSEKKSPYAMKKGSNLPKNRPFSIRKRPFTSKQREETLKLVITPPKERPQTSKYGYSTTRQEKQPPKVPQRQRWVKPITARPIRSEYSKDKMNEHFQRHQYYKNHILHRNRFVRKPKTPPKSDPEYSDLFSSASSDEEVSASSPSPAPSPEPSPTPPPEVTREDTPLFFDEGGQNTTPRCEKKDLKPKEQNYVPPSHVLKIVKAAEDVSESDWSDDDEPIFLLRDGKPGKYVRKNDKYVLIDHKIRRKRKVKKRSIKQETLDNEVIREIHYIDYENEESAKESSDDQIPEEKRPRNDNIGKDKAENNIENKAVENEEMGGGEDKTSEIQDKNPDYLAEEKGNEKKMESCNESEKEMDVKEQTADEEDDEDEDEENMDVNEEEKETEKVTEKYSNLRQDTPEDFDAKKKYDSDSDVDEFGRRNDRQRPSSSLYDYLPPLRPDPVIDENDINKCKVRLARNTVDIREALARNERSDLETVVDLIITNNNDNRRWLRKLYRDEYLQSLLLDLRKNLPADIASVISYMMIPICEYDAMCLWDALKGLHKDPEVLCEILCTRTNKELVAIRDAYSMRYGEELIDHIEDETIDIFQRILMRLASGQREENEKWTKMEAAKVARSLSALLEMKGEYLEKKVIDVFCKHSIDMLRCILSEYRKLKGHEVDVDITRVIKGNFCRCIITIMQYIQNPPNYFVVKLHNTHYKGVDDDKSLCRILISRSERDVHMIKELFLLRYDMDLFEYVNQVCHGPLKGLILRLILGNIPDDERIKYDLPPLWIFNDDHDLLQRMTLPSACMIVLRKTRVVSKCVKILFVRKERVAGNSETDSDSAVGFELEPEQNVPEEEEEVKDEVLDSEEEEERAAKEIQRELRNGLKNISFAEDVEIAGDGDPKFKSVFSDVKFAAASRGILKNTDHEEEEDQEEEQPEQELDLDDELGHLKPTGPKMTQLNGPVLDPTFMGRGDKNVSNRMKKSFINRKTKTFRGTVKGIDMENFNPLKDAQAIGKAMLQKNRNVEGILQFLTTRNNAQRQLIIREFFRRYRRDVVDDLRTLAPHHEEITLSLLLSGEIYDSASLYAAVNADNTVMTVDVLIEVLCSRQNDEIAIIKRAFSGIFSMDLREEICKVAKGDFQKLLCTIADCQRDEGDVVDENLARKDSEALYEAIVKKPTAFNVFIEIFCTRSFPHVDAVCDKFAKITRIDILEILDDTLERGFLEGITAIICNVRDAPMYFCERIYRSVSYEPADYSMLIRCCISRAEIDLQVIKAAFRRTYGRTIYAMIDKDCDFKSKKILLDVVKK